MTANPIKPARYRPGKAVPEQSSSEEESEGEASDSEAQSPSEKAPSQQKPRQPPPKATSFKNVDLKERKLAAERVEQLRKAEERVAREKMEKEAGFVTESSEGEDDDEEAVGSDGIVGARPAAAARAPGQKPSLSESDDDDDDSEADSNSSSSSSAAPKLLRPVFLRKNQRNPTKTTTTTTTETPSAPLSTHPTQSQSEALTARRLAEADALIQSELDRKAAARASAHRDWDADDTGVAEEAMIDDTDDLDPALEHSLWVARELSRLKRDRAALEEKEAELTEIERRRALPTPEREAEDRAHVEKQREEKAGRGQMAHLQRYHHKGAFYQEEGEKAGVLGRDLMSARFVDQSDKSALPAYLQRRDETKIGRKGGTRYKDMMTEDTGRFGDDLSRRGGGRGGYGGGGRGGASSYGRDEQERTGANASAVGEKRKVALTSDLLREEAKRTRVE